MNQSRRDDAFQARWKQFSRIRLMNHLWKKRHPVHIETWGVWSVTAALTLICMADSYSSQLRPLLLTADMAGLILSCGLWLRWRRKPQSWCGLIAAELASYPPADHDAFARLQQNVRQEGHLDQDALDSWIRRELRALTRQDFGFTSRNTNQETEAQHHDFAQRP
ncbi:hypothetical protein [Pantoea ananatis]|jgi:hypothetical protein|nr:hypothetical protein [Pantoea ananatis]